MNDSRLRAARKAKGLRQVDLAELVGCQQSTIVRLETGHNLPTWKLAERIAKALELPAKDLFELPEIGTAPTLPPGSEVS